MKKCIWLLCWEIDDFKGIFKDIVQFLYFIISVFIVDIVIAQKRVSSRSSLSFSLDF